MKKLTAWFKNLCARARAWLKRQRRPADGKRDGDGPAPKDQGDEV